MADQELPFKISSGLKNIIGKDLITDDFIAIFELVKNSFDAYAKIVKIIFEEDKIIIEDDGKGMDIDDLKNKWLFLAYSAKKEGVEDEELKDDKFSSYRDNIHLKEYFAGSKGIGRFSCDRLGRKLLLTTKKALIDSKIEQIEINWDDFEKDLKNEFIKINVKHRTLFPDTKKLKKFQKGTILQFSFLRSKWDRDKKIKLKQSLEKLINPFSDIENDSFKIIIQDDSEKINDEKEIDKNKEIHPRNLVNGEVRNFIFETLKLNTTQILTEIDENGEYIITSLRDRGTLVYKIRKPNDTLPKLLNIRCNLFYLNKSAKSNFKKLMGIDVIHFGSIFLYKNGVRISPYGNPGDDSFEIDKMHGQKYKETLASRDLIGRIEINGANEYFKETTSRDVGLEKNEYYNSLNKYFWDYCLLKLQNYVAKILWKSKDDKLSDDTSVVDKDYNLKSRIINLISNEVGEEDTDLMDLDTKFVNLRTLELIKDAKESEIENLKFIAEKFGDKKYEREILKTEKKVKELEKKLEEEEEEKKNIEKDLIFEKQKNKYLLTTSKEVTDILGVVHQIELTTGEIGPTTNELISHTNKDRFDKKIFLEKLTIIKMATEKILKFSKLLTRSNFNIEINKLSEDLVKYIKEYIDNYKELGIDRKIDLDFSTNIENYQHYFSFLDISVIIDNLISNSKKNGAHKVLIKLEKNEKSLKLIYSDNGNGIKSELIDHIYDLGITSTRGSGIGLYTVKKLVEDNGGNIRFIGNNKYLKGASFEINFSR
jgi:hypothetical protein